jgi:hypothetical protein
MKKLAVIFGVFVSSFGISQTIDELSIQIVNESAEWAKTTKSFKTGDNDELLVRGLLKNLLTDSTTRYEYVLRSPNIGNLLVNGKGWKPDSELINFKVWIETLPVLDTNRYEILYRINSSMVLDPYGNLFPNTTETLYIKDKISGEYIRSIGIRYTHNNFRAINDRKD